MANKRTGKSKYQSPSTGEYCTSTQYMAELMCLRMAESSNEGSLGFKFWNKGKWKKTYQHQIILANRLVKEFDEKLLMQALNSKKGQSIYSLRNKRLVELVSELKTEPPKPQSSELPTSDPLAKPKKPFGKKSRMSDWRNLDE